MELLKGAAIPPFLKTYHFLTPKPPAQSLSLPCASTIVSGHQLDQGRGLAKTTQAKKKKKKESFLSQFLAYQLSLSILRGLMNDASTKERAVEGLLCLFWQLKK